jgi:cyclophilin family peptidyl-prolyl cis-trans isomerase
MPSRSRERQLAKQHERRRAERQQAQRRKRIVAGIVGAVIGVAAIVLGVAILGGDDVAQPQTSGTPSTAPTPTATSAPPSSSASGEPGIPQRTGEVVPQAQPPATVACGGSVPDAFGEPKGQYDAAPKPGKILAVGATYTARIVTSCGTLELQLDAEGTPQTVASFVFLAREGYYDGLTFHRIIPGFMAQGGDPLGTGSGGPGYAFADEIDPGRLFDETGQLAMANSGPGTNGSQFFITFGGAEATGHLNGLHTIFGQVTSGLEVLDLIAAASTGDDAGTPAEAVYIESVRIDEQPGPDPSPSG